MCNIDPFMFIFSTLLMFHLGLKFSPIVTPAKMKFDPPRIVQAIERGSRVHHDLTGPWDFWPDLELPLDEVRCKYNITDA